MLPPRPGSCSYHVLPLYVVCGALAGLAVGRVPYIGEMALWLCCWLCSLGSTWALIPSQIFLVVGSLVLRWP